MNILFKSKKLQKVCSDSKVMSRELGEARTRRLQQRLLELRAAESLAEVSHLPPARCHELKGNRKYHFSVDLDQPYRLIFIPSSTPVPLLADGGIDRESIKDVTIIEIVDTHE